jgi:predicted acyltransferase
MSPEEQHAAAAPAQPIVVHPPLHGDATIHVPADAATVNAPVVVVRDVAPAPVAPAEGTPATAEATTASRRAHGLDALRGLFLIAMTLGFSLRGDDYPMWMYHRQMPPPDFGVEPIPGLGWRDLAYGAFLFTMAAAFPLTLSRKIAKGETEFGIIFAAIKRYGLLLMFALLVGHSNTYFTGYTQTARALGLVGLAVMALLYTRRRPDWDEKTFDRIHLFGWAAALAFLAFSPLAYQETFSFQRIDDVISGLAFAALSGSLVWYFTRDNLVARIGVLAFATALFLGSRDDGWLQQWWYYSPLPWAFAPSRLGLLTIVIPGTIAGDAVLRWMRSTESTPLSWGNGRMLTLAALAFAFAPVIVIGTYTRQVHVATQLCIAMAIGGAFLTMRPVTSVERAFRSVFLWGAVWILLGMLMEPFQGGIKKVPETLSYFFTVAGVTTMLLVSLMVVVDGLGKRRWTSALIDVGHNPLMMYVMLSIGITCALELVEPLRGVMRSTPWQSFTRSALETTLALLIVRAASRRRIYWRT